MKKQGKKKSIVEWGRSFYTHRLTRIGQFLVILLVVMSFLATNFFNAPYLIFYILSFGLFLFVFSAVIWFLLPRFKIFVDTPGRAAAGSLIYEDVKIVNDTRRDGNLIFVRESNLPAGLSLRENYGAFLPLLKAGESAVFRLHINLARRGIYSLRDLRVESPYPFGVVKVGYSHSQERSLIVYPYFKPIINFSIPAGRKLQPGGIALASDLGESTEFLGTREFREGDNLRYIHWKSWARLNKPVVKEFQQEYFCRVALFLDTFVVSGSPAKDYEAFESLLSLGASISDYLSRQEYIIDILAAGPEIYYLQAGRSLAYLDQILDIMACLDVCRDGPYRRLAPHLMEELSQISTVIVLLLGWDEERRDFLMRLKDLGTEMRVFVVTNRRESLEEKSFEGIFGKVTVLDSGEIGKGFEYL